VRDVGELLLGLAVLVGVLVGLLVVLHLVRLLRDAVRGRQGRPSLAEQIELDRQADRERPAEDVASDVRGPTPWHHGPWKPVALPPRFTRPSRRERQGRTERPDRRGP
jgi:hypothetical protein